MAVGPFGPWRQRSELEPAEPVPILSDPFNPDAAPDLPPVTGTYLDEFLPIYYWLARPTKTRAAFSQPEVDRMDLSVVAMLLGVGDSGASTFERDSLRMIQLRVEHAERGLPRPTWEDLAGR